jgi:hypothetical protein
MKSNDKATPEEPDEIDWNEVARKALGSAVLAAFVGGAMQVLGDVIRAELRAAPKRHVRDSAPVEPPPRAAPLHNYRDEYDLAGELLGVDPEAGQAEIRAALRARLAESRAHPDQGGDPEEAKILIAAQNLLLEYARFRGKP